MALSATPRRTFGTSLPPGVCVSDMRSSTVKLLLLLLLLVATTVGSVTPMVHILILLEQDKLRLSAAIPLQMSSSRSTTTASTVMTSSKLAGIATCNALLAKQP
jgi:hypothetical protein